MSDLSPEMQWQCHRVAQKACDTIFYLIHEMFKVEKPKGDKEPGEGDD